MDFQEIIAMQSNPVSFLLLFYLEPVKAPVLRTKDECTLS